MPLLTVGMAKQQRLIPPSVGLLVPIVLSGALFICFPRSPSHAIIDTPSFPSCSTLSRSATSSIANSSALSAARELRVLTYNVQFRPSLADYLSPSWPNTTERAQAIGRAIAQYDIVALQEVFRFDRLDEVLAASELHNKENGILSYLPSGRFFDVAIGPMPRHLDQTHVSFLQFLFKKLGRSVYNLFDAVRGNDHRAKAVEDSGLVLLSRYPILCTDARPYHSRAGVDAWADKGILHVAVQRGEKSGADDILDVFITHLQAGGKTYREERLAQVMELTQFIRSIHAKTPSHPILLMGDFNINGSTNSDEEAASSYLLLRHLLQQADLTLTDVWMQHHPQTPGFTKHVEPKRIDYIFVTEGHAVTSLDAQVAEFARYTTRVTDSERIPQGYLSDHNGVEARLVWR